MNYQDFHNSILDGVYETAMNCMVHELLRRAHAQNLSFENSHGDHIIQLAESLISGMVIVRIIRTLYEIYGQDYGSSISEEKLREFNNAGLFYTSREVLNIGLFNNFNLREALLKMSECNSIPEPDSVPESYDFEPTDMIDIDIDDEDIEARRLLFYEGDKSKILDFQEFIDEDMCNPN